MLLIYRIREFSFRKNNCGLVLLTQLIKLMVGVTHTSYMSVLLVVLLKENLCFLLLLKFISLVLVLWKPHIREYTVVLCNLILTRLSFHAVMMLGTPMITLVQNLFFLAYENK